jgi:hypothetical protein
MSSSPRSSYERVQESFREMEGAEDLEALRDAWEDFLVYHQRTWNKCKAYYAGNPFWGPLLPKYSAQRSNEPLLQYVEQARHADEHGIDPSSQVQLGSTIVGPGTYTVGTTIVGGGPSVLGPGSTGSVTVNPATVTTRSVKNRGVTFDPPVLNGKSNPRVIDVAREALKFYENLFSEIDAAGGD